MKKNIIETIKSNVILMHNEYEKQKGQININHISWGTYTYVLTRCEQNWIERMWLLLLNMFSLFFVDARRDKKNCCFILILFLMHIWRVLTSIIIIKRCRVKTLPCTFISNHTYTNRTVTVAFWRKHIGKFMVSNAQVEHEHQHIAISVQYSKQRAYY